MENKEAELARTIGKTIARYRQARKLTQDELAERLGIGNEAVSRIERGLVMPSIARLMELAGIFQCETADLLMQASFCPSDQARYLEQRLAQLTHADQKLVLEMVEMLASRLAKTRAR